MYLDFRIAAEILKPEYLRIVILYSGQYENEGINEVGRRGHISMYSFSGHYIGFHGQTTGSSHSAISGFSCM